MISRRFLKFVLVGGLAALANIGARIALNQLMNYSISIILAYMIGMLTAFILNRIFVFTDASEQMHKQAAWFLLINLFAIVQTFLISIFLARWAFPAIGMNFHPDTVAHCMGVAAPILSSYVGHSKLSFKNHA